MKQLDEAQKLETEERDTLIARHRARFAPLLIAPEWDAALDCLECGKEIPAERREALPGVMVCVECKEKSEKQNKRGY